MEVEKQAQQALPENRPVTQVTASLKLLIKGKPPFPYQPDKKNPQGHVAHLNIGESAHWQPSKRGPWVLDLVAKEVECWSSTTEADYFAEFQAEPIFNLIDEPAGQFIDHVDFFDLFPSFLPLNTHIDGGTLTIKVNSTLSKELPIPAQKFDTWNTIRDVWNQGDLTPSPNPLESPSPTASP